MTNPSISPAETTYVERLLRRFDRLPLLGGGRTHIVFLALFFAVSLLGYLLILKVRGPARMFITWTTWDEAFPFTLWWTWVYLIPYAVGPLLVGTLRRTTFIWYVQRATVVVVISLVIFAIVPTHTVRPNVQIDDSLTATLYRQMVEIDDPPANAAPSLHVSLSCLLAWAIAFDRPRWWLAALFGAILVWLSTLFTAQHHLIDVMTGAILASLAAIGPPRYS